MILNKLRQLDDVPCVDHAYEIFKFCTVFKIIRLNETHFLSRITPSTVEYFVYGSYGFLFFKMFKNNWHSFIIKYKFWNLFSPTYG